MSRKKTNDYLAKRNIRKVFTDFMIARPRESEEALNKAHEGLEIRVRGMTTEINEKEQIEKQLRTEKQRFQTLSENAPFGMVMIDAEGIFRYINPKFKELFGYDLKDIPNGREWFRKAYPNPSYRHHVISTWIDDLRSSRPGEKRPRIFRVVCKDGTEKIIHFIPVQLETNENLIACEDITERVRADEALRKSQQLLESTFISLRDAVFIIEANTEKIIECNPAASEIFGYSRNEMVGRTINLLHVDEASLEGFRKHLHTAVEKQGFLSFLEFRMKRRDGTIFPTENSVVPLEDGQGNRIGWVSVVRDGTYRKHAEEALRESEERYRGLVEGATDAIFTLSLNGTITSLNLAFETITGWSRTEWIGKSFSPILHPDDLLLAMDLFQKVLNGETPPMRELRIRLKSGEYRTGEFVANPQIQNGRVVGILGIARDTTERKRAEEAAQQNLELIGRIKREWESTADSLPQLICLLDHQGNILRTNRTVERWNIGRVTNVKGQGLHQLLHLDCKEPSCYLKTFWIHAWEELNCGRTAECEAEDRMIKRYVYVQARPIGPQPYRQGEETDSFAVVVLNDVTEQKQAENDIAAHVGQLRHSQKMEAIGQPAGGIAHDFNNLITLIKGYSQLCLRELNEPVSLKENIEEIQKASQPAEDLTRQLLAFRGRQIVDMKLLDLNALLQDLDKTLRRVIGENIELIYVLAEDLGRVKTGPGQIEQVILNLAINARDAMPNGGKLIIETRNVELDEGTARTHVGVHPGPYVMFSLSDTGMGMTPETKEHIFEPFSTTKEQGKGTGLGLSTVYGIVKQNGGNTWAYSEPGRGTTFKIYLPRVDERLEEIGEKVVAEKTLRGSETILAVEDDEEVRKLAVRILKKQGYTVFEASHGEEALRVAKEHARGGIHLLLTDVVMPGVSGPELAEGLTLILPEMKVIYMSGYTDNAVIHQGVLERGVNYIQKPFTPDSLARKVREVLDKK